jgi:hypothetical protein
MPIDVIVISNDKFNIKEICRWTEIEGHPRKNDDWKKTTHRLTIQALTNNHSDIEVFLCFRGDLLISDFNFYFIGEILKYATDSFWGANVYLVVDRSIENSAQDSLRKFLNIALENRVCDIFEVGTEDSIYLRDNGEIDLDRILASILPIKNNRYLSFVNLSTSGWDCVIPKNLILSDENLIPFGSTKVNSVNDSGLLVYCSGDERYAKVFIKRSLKKYKSRRLSIANVSNCLDQGLKKTSLPAGIGLIDFIGYVDLAYYLKKLNQKRKLLDDSEILQPISLVNKPQLNPFQIPPNPRLLIVNAFAPNEGNRLCNEAASEAGLLKNILETDAEIEIHPGLDFKQLPNIIKVSPLTVWMFQGHGLNGKLKDLSKECQTPDELLKRFTHYNSQHNAGLAMVFFASCNSDLFAEFFAANGVGVAIGFGANVTSFETRIVAEEVIPVAIRTKDKTVFVDEVLRAFRNATDKLIAHGRESVKPVAFYTKR